MVLHTFSWRALILTAACFPASQGLRVLNQSGTGTAVKHAAGNGTAIRHNVGNSTVTEQPHGNSTSADLEHDMGKRNDTMYRHVPDNSSSPPKFARLPHSNTWFVLKSFGNFTPWEKYISRKYHDDLLKIGIEMSILRDVTKEPSKFHSDGVKHTVEVLENGIEIPVCEVSWDDAILRWGNKLHGFQPGNTYPKLFGGVHNPYTMLWWNECSPPGLDYVWFVENDAFYNGNVANFVGMFLNENADLLSGGFRVAGNTWWQYDIVNSLNVPHVRKNGEQQNSSGYWQPGKNPAVKNLPELPSFGVPYTSCRDGTRYSEEGVLFRQDHVDRWSKNMFQIVNNAMSIGLFAPGEVYAPEVCLAWANVAPSSSCTMYDFAPLEQQRWGRSPVAPLYCWHQGWDKYTYANHIKFNLCTDEWKEKWIHPAKPEYMDLPGVQEAPCLSYGRSLKKNIKLKQFET